jgi:hypothetical protein
MGKLEQFEEIINANGYDQQAAKGIGQRGKTIDLLEENDIS